MKKDYYAVLGITKDASKANIKKAYRQLALKYHPDKSDDPQAEERFKEISEAYAVLSDEEKRQQYDRLGHAGIDSQYSYQDIFRGADFSDIFRDLGFNLGFSDIFQQFFGGMGRGSQRKRQGSDILYRITVSLEDAYFGVEKDINLTRTERCIDCNGNGAADSNAAISCSTCRGSGQIRQSHRTPFGHLTQVTVCTKCNGEGQLIENPCPACNGSGVVPQQRTITVSVPKGVKSGMRLRLAGEGEAGQKGAPIGDMYVEVYVKDDERFRRDDDTLFTTAQISFPQAALGSEIEVKTMNGSKQLRIPSGTQSGETFILKGKGMPRLLSGYGNLIVQVKIDIPKKLTAKQRELVKMLGDEMDTETKESLSTKLFGRGT